jgi:hypothetical protein
LTTRSITTYIDRVVNNKGSEMSLPTGLQAASGVLGIYVAVTVGTIVALAVMSSAAPPLATREAWGHALIVAVFAIVLPLRMRAARRGSVRGLVAVAVIAAVLVVVNVVEAALPGAFPGWMRIEMVAIAVLMAGLASLAARSLRQPRRG